MLQTERPGREYAPEREAKARGRVGGFVTLVGGAED